MSNRVSLVLSILDAANRLGEPPLYRTSVVKLVYLCELLRPSYRIWWETFKFSRYRYGPYTDDVMACLDALVFHGFAAATEYTRTGGGVRVRYAVTDAGASAIARVRERTETFRVLESLALDVLWCLQGMGIRSARSLCRLVYSEPAFDHVAQEALAKNIPPMEAIPLPRMTASEHPSFELQAIIGDMQRKRRLGDVAPREHIRRFLQYLAVGTAARTNPEAVSLD